MATTKAKVIKMDRRKQHEEKIKKLRKEAIDIEGRKRKVAKLAADCYDDLRDADLLAELEAEYNVKGKWAVISKEVPDIPATVLEHYVRASRVWDELESSGRSDLSKNPEKSMSLTVARALGSKSGDNPDVIKRGVQFATELAEHRNRKDGRVTEQDAIDAAKAARNPKVTNIRRHAQKIDQAAEVKRIEHAFEQINDVAKKYTPQRFCKFMDETQRMKFLELGTAINWLMEIYDNVKD